MIPPLLALAACAQSPEPRAAAAEDAAPLARFRALTEGERRDLRDYFRLEVSRLGTFQASLVEYVLSRQDRDPAAWPEDGPAPVFDPKEHTPENDIPRHRIAADSPQATAMARRMLGKPAPAEPESAWRYDYGARALLRSKDWKDPERIFRNGLKGYAPDLDLATSLVERQLDDGAQQGPLAALGHAYTDRDGGVYPGITLYDAWASGAEIEMPDVDALGIVHTVLADFTTWRAPVPSSQHDALYERIGELFVPAHRHRTLRRALAASYLSGSPVLRDGFEAYLDNLHALWEDCRSTPEDLAERLPDSSGREEFLSAWTKTCFEKGDLFQAGLARRATLEKDREVTRALLLRLLDEFSAPERPAAGGGGR